MICGQLHSEEASENLLIAALPEVIVLHAGQPSQMDRVRTLMFCIRDELDGNNAGAIAIATDLASALFIMMLRQHLANYPPAEGLLALLGQRATAKAVIAILRMDARRARRLRGGIARHAYSLVWPNIRCCSAHVPHRAQACSGPAAVGNDAQSDQPDRRRYRPISPKQLSVARSNGASGSGRANFA
jgi:hypothetical protein